MPKGWTANNKDQASINTDRESITCIECNRKNSEGSLFCNYCGTKFEPITTDASISEMEPEIRVKYYEKILQTNPEDYLAWNSKGLALMEMEKFQEALNSYNRALEKHRSDYLILQNKARALNSLNMEDEAIKCYGRVLDLAERDISSNPDHVDALVAKAGTLLDLQRYDNAAQCYSKLIELIPSEKMFWKQKGFALSELGDYPEALKCLDQALKIDPMDAEAWNNKAFVLGFLERYEEEIECHNKVLEIEPKNVDAWCNKGLVLSNLDRLEGSLECYGRATDLNPNDSNIWNSKGLTLMYLKKYPEAISCFEKSLELDPTNIDPLYNTALTKIRMQLLDEAFVKLEEAIKKGGKEYRQLAIRDEVMKGTSGDERFKKLIESESNDLLSSKKVKLENESAFADVELRNGKLINSPLDIFSVVFDDSNVCLKEMDNLLWVKEFDRPTNAAVSNNGTVALLHKNYNGSSLSVLNKKPVLGGKLSVIEKSGNILFTYEFTSNIQGCAISEDSRLVSVSTLLPDNSVYCFDMNTKQLLWKHRHLRRQAILALKFRGNELDVFTGHTVVSKEKDYALNLDGTLTADYQDKFDSIEKIKKQDPKHKVESLLAMTTSNNKRDVMEGLSLLASFVNTKGSLVHYPEIVKVLGSLLQGKDNFFDPVMKVTYNMMKKQPEMLSPIVPRIISKVKEIATQGDEDTSILAVLGNLGQVNPNWVIGELQYIKLKLKSKFWNERRFASFAIGGIGSVNLSLVKDVIPLLIEYIVNPESVNKEIQEMSRTIETFDSGIEIESSLSVNTTWLQDACIDAIGMIGKRSPEAVSAALPILEKLSKNAPSPYTQKKAARALERITRRDSNPRQPDFFRNVKSPVLYLAELRAHISE